jgi:hypothetical protein
VYRPWTIICYDNVLQCTEVVCYNAQVLDYNVLGGKLNRGMAVLDALRALKGQDKVHCPIVLSNEQGKSNPAIC